VCVWRRGQWDRGWGVRVGRERWCSTLVLRLLSPSLYWAAVASSDLRAAAHELGGQPQLPVRVTGREGGKEMVQCPVSVFSGP